MLYKCRILIMLLSGLVLISQNIYAQGVTKVGTTAGNFLVIDVGPRGTAMGSAFVSVANDVSAMYWNPAGVAGINNFQTMFTNMKWIADLSFNYAGVVISLEDFGNVGVNATFLNMEEMERTTELNPNGTGEFFDAGCFAIGLTYARFLTDRFAIGANIKYINERYYHSSAGGFAFDIGTLFETRFYGLKFGMSISNYGTKMQLDGRDLDTQVDPDPTIGGNNPNINARYKTDPFDIPLLLRVGISMDVLKGSYKSNLILSADALHPSDDVESVNIGGEYVFDNLLFLRVGWKDLFKEDTQQSVTFGAGLKYNLSGVIISFDFSYLYFHKLGDIQMFSIGLGL